MLLYWLVYPARHHVFSYFMPHRQRQTTGFLGFLVEPFRLHTAWPNTRQKITGKHEDMSPNYLVLYKRQL